MRVISGSRKGHKLKSPKGNVIRPTEDKVKESLFNILGEIDNKSLVLDLFAGSGAIGIEFLSRGAKECYFIDKSSDSIHCIKDNLAHTKFVELSKVIKSDSIKSIKQLHINELKFDYIYVDPPFRHENLIDNIFSTLQDYPILSINGLIIIEHESKLVLEDYILLFKKIDERRYGSKIISFFRTSNGR